MDRDPRENGDGVVALTIPARAEGGSRLRFTKYLT